MIDKKIFVAGHRGMVGGAVVRRLQALGVAQIVTADRRAVDLRRQTDVEAFFAAQRPDWVVFAAAKVGGIHANHTYPAQFIYDNLAMATHCIEAAYRAGVQRFLFLGSTCIYPRMAPQPIQESALLTSPLEETNEAYALAKIAGLKLCQFYRQQYGVLFHSAMPTNLYGPGDNYHPQDSHVLPALIRRFHEAKVQNLPQVTVWGSGRPRREFLHVDDLAAAIVHLLQLENPPDWVNVGTGIDIAIADLARLVAQVVGYAGEIMFDTSKPDGTPVKRTDISLIRGTGWEPRIDFEAGLRSTYADFLGGQVRGFADQLQPS
jgi:GDP-L-fucose synthase